MLDFFQELIDDLCPEIDYKLSKSDIIYKVVRTRSGLLTLRLSDLHAQAQQQVYEWRIEFANVAVGVIHDTITHKFGPKAKATLIRKWVRAATAEGGEALWGKPHKNVSQLVQSSNTRSYIF